MIVPFSNTKLQEQTFRHCFRQQQQKRDISTSTTTRGIVQNGIHHFFQLLEEKYGGNLPMDAIGTSSSEVIVSKKYIQTEHLQRLMKHDALAIHVKNFYCTKAAIDLGKQLAYDSMNGKIKEKRNNWKISTTNRGLESSDVHTIGEHVPYNIAVSSSKVLSQNPNTSLLPSSSSSPTIIEEYFIGVQNELRKRRIKINNARMTSSLNNDKNNENNTIYNEVIEEEQIPQLWPLDLLRLQLDEAWPSGAGLARRYSTTSNCPQHTISTNHYFDNPPFGGGLTRIMHGPTRWKKGYVHVDEMGPLNPNRGLFSANIYLKLPQHPLHGKEPRPLQTNANSLSYQDVIEIWPLGIRTRWDWYRNAQLLSSLSIQDSYMQSMLRAKLGPPICIEACPGDLIVLCVQRPHAAIGFTDANDVRVSLQCFIQHSGINERLLIDC